MGFRELFGTMADDEFTREIIYWVIYGVLFPLHVVIFPTFSWWFCLSVTYWFMNEDCQHFYEWDNMEAAELWG